MATYKRISGDYTINTITAGSNVVLDTSNVQVAGNVTATGNVTAPNFIGNIYANGFFYANGTPFSGGGGGNASLPLSNGTSNFNIAQVNGNATITTAGTNTWTFDTTGNLNLPTNGDINFNAGGIVQTPDENFVILVQDADDDGFAIVNSVDDGFGNVLGTTELQRDRYVIEFAGGSAPQFRFTDDGQTEIPGNIRATEYVDTSIYSVSDGGGNGTVELKTISYAGDVLGSNVRVTESNATISTNNAEFTWLFDDTGTLTLPGLTGHIASGTDTVDIFSDVDEYNGVTVSNVATNILNQGNVGIVTSSGTANTTWQFDNTGNLTLPGNTFAVNYANGSPVNISGGGGGYGNAEVATFLDAFGSNSISTTGNVTAAFFTGNGAGLTDVNAVTVDITDTNGLTTIYYPTFVENRANAQIARADVDLTYRTDDNLLSVGNLSATGNVTAAFFTGNGAGLTGVIATGNVGTASQLANGTTSLNVPVADGNIIGNISGTANVLVFSNLGLQVNGIISASGNVDAGNLHTSGVVSATGNVRGGNINTVGAITATGNITGGNIVTGGVITATGNIAGNYVLGNGALLTGLPATYSNANVAAYLPTYSGNVSAGNVLVSGDISASGNITGLNINSINADLAECYQSDVDYEPGTVVMFGGIAEVTICNTDACPQVAGVISANPAYKMNSGLIGTHVATVALVGRVPVKVQGPVSAGAMMVSAGNGRARAEAAPAMGTVIGKAVQSHADGFGTIEIVVGRI